MAQSQGTQGSSHVGFGAPLKEIANLYGTIPSAPTPSTKDLGHKETISPIVAQLAQVLAEHLKGTMAAQTPGNKEGAGGAVVDCRHHPHQER